MPTDDEDDIFQPTTNDRPRPQANRTALGLLLALLFVAIVLAIWFLLFDGDDSTAADTDPTQAPIPTALTVATSTPVPDTGAAVEPTTAPTTAPVATATPVPEGFEPCDTARAPSTTATYIVYTNTTPLNQRTEPAVGATQAGTFDPGQAGLVFSGECVVNINDGYVWWKINNGTEDVWIASEFVTPN